MPPPKTKRERDKDVFEELEEFDIMFSRKLRNIFTRLQFQDLRSISMIENVKEIEEAVCTILGSESYQQELSVDDKNLIFGPMPSCIANPSTFKFMPGESNSIKGALKCPRLS